VGDGGAEARVASVAADHLDAVGYRRGTGTVDHADRLAAAAESVQGGQADGSGSEDHVVRGGGHVGFPIWE
jgi:uncharacterized membrane protein YqiK